MMRYWNTCALRVAYKANYRTFFFSAFLLSASLSPLSATEDLGPSDLLEHHKSSFFLSQPLEQGMDLYPEETFLKEFPFPSGQKIRLTYSGTDRTISAYRIDPSGQETDIKDHDLPRILRQVTSLKQAQALLDKTYAHLRSFSNGEVSFSLYQKGFGGGTLHDAAMEEDITQLALLLKNSTVRSQINEKDADNCTPLHCAASSGQLEAVRLLLDQGANINSINADGMTALHVGVQNRNLHICVLLLLRGVDCTVKDENGRTALQLAIENANGEAIQLLEEWSRSHVSSKNQALQPVSLTFPTDTTEEAFRLQVQQTPALTKLDLTGCTKLSEGAIEWMTQELPGLKELNLTRCTQVTAVTVEFLMEALEGSLEKLILDGIPGLRRATFLQLQQAGIAFSPEGGALETLDCSQVKAFNDEKLSKQLLTHPNIRLLNLKGCKFLTDSGLKYLTLLQELDTLDIRGCTRLTAASVESLAKNLSLRGLKELLSDHPAPLTPTPVFTRSFSSSIDQEVANSVHYYANVGNWIWHAKTSGKSEADHVSMTFRCRDMVESRLKLLILEKLSSGEYSDAFSLFTIFDQKAQNVGGYTWGNPTSHLREIMPRLRTYIADQSSHFFIILLQTNQFTKASALATAYHIMDENLSEQWAVQLNSLCPPGGAVKK